ncbi:hypothetical protein B4144_2973 [Bacillus atrophaeus]|nr:hypothetical protein B4144_2973 [Bacillus atrophaeus]
MPADTNSHGHENQRKYPIIFKCRTSNPLTKKPHGDAVLKYVYI